MLQTSIQSEPVAMPTRPLGSVIRSVAGYAVVLTLMLIGLPLFVFIPAALFHCGIRNGRRAAWVALGLAVLAAWGLTTASAMAPGISVAEVNAGYSIVVAFFFASALPAMAVMPMVERGESFGRVLMSATCLSAVGLALTEASMRAFAHFSPFADQIQHVREMAPTLVKTYQSAGVPSEMLAALRQWVDLFIYCLPAFLLINIVVMFVLSLVMLGRLKVFRDFLEHREASPNPYLLRNLSLPDWLLLAVVAGGVTPLLLGVPRQIGANLLTAVAFLYSLQTMAVLRSIFATLGATIFGTVAVFFVLFALPTLVGTPLLKIIIAPLVLSIAGIFDSFFDFRHFNRKDDSHEGHID